MKVSLSKRMVKLKTLQNPHMMEYDTEVTVNELQHSYPQHSHLKNIMLSKKKLRYLPPKMLYDTIYIKSKSVKRKKKYEQK